MPIYEIEVIRLVEHRGIVTVEAANENEAHASAQAEADSGAVPMTLLYDHTHLGWIRSIGPTDAEFAALLEDPPF